MSEPTEITSDCMVAFHYTLTGADGEVIDTSDGGDPLTYLHGAGHIVPGLERAMEGKAVGARFDVEVPPAEGYGERMDYPPQAVPRSMFPAGMPLQAGMSFIGQDPHGNQVPLWIVDVVEDKVLLDDQHPMAGKTLFFAVEVVSIRAASADELGQG